MTAAIEACEPVYPKARSERLCDAFCQGGSRRPGVFTLQHD